MKICFPWVFLNVPAFSTSIYYFLLLNVRCITSSVTRSTEWASNWVVSPDWRWKKKSIGARQIEACDFTSSSVPANVWLPWPGWVSLGRTDNHSSTMASANVNYIWSEIYNSYNWSLKCTCMQSWSGNLGKLQISIYVEYDFVFEYITNLLLLGHWLWPRTLVGSLIY